MPVLAGELVEHGLGEVFRPGVEVQHLLLAGGAGRPGGAADCLLHPAGEQTRRQMQDQFHSAPCMHCDRRHSWHAAASSRSGCTPRDARATSASRRSSHCETTISTTVNTSSTVAAALTTGRSFFTCSFDAISSGSVVRLRAGDERRDHIIVDRKREHQQRPGHDAGHHQRELHPPERAQRPGPRSIAASSSERSNPARRARTTIATYETLNATWAMTTVRSSVATR